MLSIYCRKMYVNLESNIVYYSTFWWWYFGHCRDLSRTAIRFKWHNTLNTFNNTKYPMITISSSCRKNLWAVVDVITKLYLLNHWIYWIINHTTWGNFHIVHIYSIILILIILNLKFANLKIDNTFCPDIRIYIYFMESYSRHLGKSSQIGEKGQRKCT